MFKVTQMSLVSVLDVQRLFLHPAARPRWVRLCWS